MDHDGIFFVSPIGVGVQLEGIELRKQVEMKREQEKNISCPMANCLYQDSSDMKENTI